MLNNQQYAHVHRNCAVVVAFSFLLLETLPCRSDDLLHAVSQAMITLIVLHPSCGRSSFFFGCDEFPSNGNTYSSAQTIKCVINAWHQTWIAAHMPNDTTWPRNMNQRPLRDARSVKWTKLVRKNVAHIRLVPVIPTNTNESKLASRAAGSRQPTRLLFCPFLIGCLLSEPVPPHSTAKFNGRTFAFVFKNLHPKWNRFDTDRYDVYCFAFMHRKLMNWLRCRFSPTTTIAAKVMRLMMQNIDESSLTCALDLECNRKTKEKKIKQMFSHSQRIRVAPDCLTHLNRRIVEHIKKVIAQMMSWKRKA